MSGPTDTVLEKHVRGNGFDSITVRNHLPDIKTIDEMVMVGMYARNYNRTPGYTFKPLASTNAKNLVYEIRKPMPAILKVFIKKDELLMVESMDISKVADGKMSCSIRAKDPGNIDIEVDTTYQQARGARKGIDVTTVNTIRFANGQNIPKVMLKAVELWIRMTTANVRKIDRRVHAELFGAAR